jgi:hypothetical protein
MVVVAVVGDTRSLSMSLDGLPGVAVGPEPTLDCCRHCPGPFSMVLMPGEGRVRAMCEWCSRSTTLRPLA